MFHTSLNNHHMGIGQEIGWKTEELQIERFW